MPEIVESIVSQTFSDYKIVIRDDFSPENPEKIVADIKKKYRKIEIEYTRNRKNVGEMQNIMLALAENFNKNFKYLVNLQDDTIYSDKNFLKNAINALEKNPDAGFCNGLFFWHGNAPKLIKTPENEKIIKISGHDFYANWDNFASNWTATVFRFDEFFSYVFSSEKQDVMNQDSLLLLRLALKSKNVLLYNNPVSEIAFKQGKGNYETMYKDVVDKFQKVQKYFEYATESAKKSGVNPEFADAKLFEFRLNCARAVLNHTISDREKFQEFVKISAKSDERLLQVLMNDLAENFRKPAKT